MAHIVTAGLVTVETDVGPGRARVDVPRGELLPADAPLEDVERLVAAGDVVEVDDLDEALLPAGPDPDEVPDGTIVVVLDWVAGDPERAARALEAERAKGDRARSTLVEHLAELVNQQ